LLATAREPAGRCRLRQCREYLKKAHERRRSW